MRSAFHATLAATVVGLSSGASTVAWSQDALSIANNDSILIDATTFKVAPGRAKGDLSAQIKTFGARELGQGAIVFRASDRLYIVEPNAARAYGSTQPYAYDPSDPRRFAVDPNRPFAYDPGDARRFFYDLARPIACDLGYTRRFAYDPARPFAYDPGDPRRFAYDPARPFAYDPGDPRRFAYDPARPFAHDPSDPRRYAYDPGDPRSPLINNPYGGDRQTVYVNDPDYAQYRLKKIFDENWTAAGAK